MRCVGKAKVAKGATAWTFRATMPADTDFLSIDLDGDVIEFSRLGRDTHHARDRALPLEIKQVFTGRRKQQTKPALSKAVASAQETQDGRENMTVDGGGDRLRLDDGKSLPGQGPDDATAKRPKTGSTPVSTGPHIPGGMKLIDNVGQGDCLGFGGQ